MSGVDLPNIYDEVYDLLSPAARGLAISVEREDGITYLEFAIREVEEDIVKLCVQRMENDSNKLYRGFKEKVGEITKAQDSLGEMW